MIFYFDFYSSSGRTFSQENIQNALPNGDNNSVTSENGCSSFHSATSSELLANLGDKSEVSTDNPEDNSGDYSSNSMNSNSYNNSNSNSLISNISSSNNNNNNSQVSIETEPEELEDIEELEEEGLNEEQKPEGGEEEAGSDYDLELELEELQSETQKNSRMLRLKRRQSVMVRQPSALSSHTQVDRSDWVWRAYSETPGILEIKERIDPISRLVNFGQQYLPKRKDSKDSSGKNDVIMLILQYLHYQGLKNSRKELEALSRVKRKYWLTLLF